VEVSALPDTNQLVPKWVVCPVDAGHQTNRHSVLTRCACPHHEQVRWLALATARTTFSAAVSGGTAGFWRPLHVCEFAAQRNSHTPMCAAVGKRQALQLDSKAPHRARISVQSHLLSGEFATVDATNPVLRPDAFALRLFRRQSALARLSRKTIDTHHRSQLARLAGSSSRRRTGQCDWCMSGSRSRLRMRGTDRIGSRSCARPSWSDTSRRDISAHQRRTSIRHSRRTDRARMLGRTRHSSSCRW
jgi:hypothetical protein